MMSTPIEVQVFSDYLCPWCWPAAVHLKRLREEFGTAVKVTHKAFLLRPEDAPREFAAYHLQHRVAANEATGLSFHIPRAGDPYPRSSTWAQEAAKWVEPPPPRQTAGIRPRPLPGLLPAHDGHFEPCHPVEVGQPARDGRRRAGRRARGPRPPPPRSSSDHEEAERLGVNVVPCVIIGHGSVSGFAPYEEYAAAVREELAGATSGARPRPTPPPHRPRLAQGPSQLAGPSSAFPPPTSACPDRRLILPWSASTTRSASAIVTVSVPHGRCNTAVAAPGRVSTRYSPGSSVTSSTCPADGGGRADTDCTVPPPGCATTTDGGNGVRELQHRARPERHARPERLPLRRVSLLRPWRCGPRHQQAPQRARRRCRRRARPRRRRSGLPEQEVYHAQHHPQRQHQRARAPRRRRQLAPPRPRPRHLAREARRARADARRRRRPAHDLHLHRRAPRLRRRRRKRLREQQRPHDLQQPDSPPTGSCSPPGPGSCACAASAASSAANRRVTPA